MALPERQQVPMYYLDAMLTWAEATPTTQIAGTAGAGFALAVLGLGGGALLASQVPPGPARSWTPLATNGFIVALVLTLAASDMNKLGRVVTDFGLGWTNVSAFALGLAVPCGAATWWVLRSRPSKRRDPIDAVPNTEASAPARDDPFARHPHIRAGSTPGVRP